MDLQIRRLREWVAIGLKIQCGRFDPTPATILPTYIHTLKYALLALESKPLIFLALLPARHAPLKRA
jgi:hypothetical protein